MAFQPPSTIGPPSPLLADNIDPVTKDLADLFVGVDPIDDQVQVTVMTTRGSGGSVLDIGLRIGRRKMLADLQSTLEGDIRQALSSMIANRDIAFKRITFGTDPNQTGQPTGAVDEANAAAQMNVEYRNLRAFDPVVRRLQLSSRLQRIVVS